MLLKVYNGKPGDGDINLLTYTDDLMMLCTIYNPDYKEIFVHDRDIIERDEKKFINVKKLKAGINEVEFPVEHYPLLVRRARARKERELTAGAICEIKHEKGRIFFFLDVSKALLTVQLVKLDSTGQLGLNEPDLTANATEIEMIYGKKTVKVESLELGYPYLELPADVAKEFEHAIKQNEFKNIELGLIPAGTSLLNGKQYYRMTHEIPEFKFNTVKQYFEWFGNVGEMQGWLTCEPETVAGKLGIKMAHN